MAAGLEPFIRSKLDKYRIRDEILWSLYGKLDKHSLIYSGNLSIRITLQLEAIEQNNKTTPPPPRSFAQKRLAKPQPFQYRSEGRILPRAQLRALPRLSAVPGLYSSY